MSHNHSVIDRLCPTHRDEPWSPRVAVVTCGRVAPPRGKASHASVSSIRSTVHKQRTVRITLTCRGSERLSDVLSHQVNDEREQDRYPKENWDRPLRPLEPNGWGRSVRHGRCPC